MTPLIHIKDLIKGNINEINHHVWSKMQLLSCFAARQQLRVQFSALQDSDMKSVSGISLATV